MKKLTKKELKQLFENKHINEMEIKLKEKFNNIEKKYDSDLYIEWEDIYYDILYPDNKANELQKENLDDFLTILPYIIFKSWYTIFLKKINKTNIQFAIAYFKRRIPLFKRASEKIDNIINKSNFVCKEQLPEHCSFMDISDIEYKWLEAFFHILKEKDKEEIYEKYISKEFKYNFPIAIISKDKTKLLYNENKKGYHPYLILKGKDNIYIYNFKTIDDFKDDLNGYYLYLVSLNDIMDILY